MPPLPQECYFSYADLLAWDDNTRYELYNGQPVALASPSDIHQRILGELHLQFGTYLRGKKCRVYLSPFDVRLFEKRGELPENIDTVVQPDLMVVCDPNKVDRHGVHGAPDLVIEILSPTSARYDKITKFNLYQRAGVLEYWLVDPSSRTVSVYLLEDGVYHAATVYSSDLSVPVGVLDNCYIDLPSVFQ
ncbi:MAG: Uma2 family endonuclease [Oscillospiraceae bacterium]|nr:Uma2 family endonuclease [Oscillospiraceae bacterium]